MSDDFRVQQNKASILPSSKHTRMDALREHNLWTKKWAAQRVRNHIEIRWISLREIDVWKQNSPSLSLCCGWALVSLFSWMLQAKHVFSLIVCSFFCVLHFVHVYISMKHCYFDFLSTCLQSHEHGTDEWNCGEQNFHTISFQPKAMAQKSEQYEHCHTDTSQPKWIRLYKL